jgi:hypothetical protein
MFVYTSNSGNAACRPDQLACSLAVRTLIHPPSGTFAEGRSGWIDTVDLRSSVNVVVLYFWVSKGGGQCPAEPAAGCSSVSCAGSVIAGFGATGAAGEVVAAGSVPCGTSAGVAVAASGSAGCGALLPVTAMSSSAALC